MRGAPTGGPGGVVGEVDDGGEEEEDGRDTEDYQVGVDVLSQLLSGLTAHICTDALNLQSNTPTLHIPDLQEDTIMAGS